MPPSYADAMALSDKFMDDVDYLQNTSMSSINTSSGKNEPYKPRYPVYYDYETPTIPPGSDESSSDINIDNENAIDIV